MTIEERLAEIEAEMQRLEDRANALDIGRDVARFANAAARNEHNKTIAEWNRLYWEAGRCRIALWRRDRGRSLTCPITPSEFALPMDSRRTAARRRGTLLGTPRSLAGVVRLRRRNRGLGNPRRGSYLRGPGFNHEHADTTTTKWRPSDA